jgi:hypothetical protein
MSLESEFEEQRLRQLLRLIGSIRFTDKPSYGRIHAIMMQAKDNIAKDIQRYKIHNPPGTYSGNFFKYNRRLAEQIYATLKGLNDGVYTSISDAMVSSWELADEKNNALVAKYTKGVNIPESLAISMHQLNVDAMNAFIKRADNGLNLSKRIWNYTVAENRTKLELYLSSGITAGRSANQISRDIRELLYEPDKLFRRVRDKETGELVLSKAAKAYHPGQGVYRSSYKNALRVAASETNMAYRYSDSYRRRKLPFVNGVRVHLSDAHPRLDICDSMQGDYPVGFLFGGWHPSCLCYSTSILTTKEEFVHYIKTRHIDQRKYIRSIPQKAQRYIQKHGPQMQKWNSQPYFLADNFTKDFKLKESVIHARPEIPVGK